MAGPRLTQRTSASYTTTASAGSVRQREQQQTEDSMFKSDHPVSIRNPFPRAKKASPVLSDNIDPSSVAKAPSIGGKFLARPSNRSVTQHATSTDSRASSRTASASSALATLTRFHSRNANQSAASSVSFHSQSSNDSICSSRERSNDDLESGSNASMSSLPSIGNSELPRLVSNAGASNVSGNIVTSQATTTSAISYAPRVNNSGRASPPCDPARKRQPRGLVGLQNLGNTCFMNSCLQCVSNIPALVKYFHPGLYSREINDASPTKGALATAFGDLIKALWSGDKFSATRPVELKRVIGKVASRFTGYDQQDAQEFLRFLLDGLHEDLNRVKKKPAYYEIKDRVDAKDRDISDEYWNFYLERNASALSELFCGQLRSEIRCGTCNHRSLCFDVFWDLSLPVPKKPGKGSASSHLRLSGSFFSGGSRSSIGAEDGTSSGDAVKPGGVSIHDCLKSYTEQEFLTDDAAYYCGKCKTHRSVAKKISVYRLPNVLVLHLKRFSFSSFSRDKVSTAINFPAQSLDLAEYCASDAVIDGSTLYDLTGVVHHMGSLNGGHYTAECLNGDLQEWFDFNDGSVSAVKKPELTSSSAYMLFYQRREEKSLTI